MENCTLIDENEDKEIPITAGYFRESLAFCHPSKEGATKQQIWAANWSSINTHIHNHISPKTQRCHELHGCKIHFRDKWHICGSTNALEWVHNAYQLKNACSGNRNSKASTTWKMRSGHQINATNIKGCGEFQTFSFIRLCSTTQHSIFQPFSAQNCIDGRFSAVSSNENPYLVTCNEITASGLYTVCKAFLFNTSARRRIYCTAFNEKWYIN